MGRFAFLPDLAPGDCAVALEAPTLADLLATAARALADVMVDPATLPRSREDEIALAAESPDLLLFDWLGELILRKDRDREVVVDAHVRVAHDGDYRLTARVTTGSLDAPGVAWRADPKAVTFHQFDVHEHGGTWYGRVVLDL